MASGEDGVVDQVADNSFWQIESGPAKRVAGSSAQSAPSMYLSLISNQLQTQNTATTQSSNIPKRPQPANIYMNSQKPCSQYSAPQQNPFLSIGGDSAMNSNGGSSPRTFVSGGGCPAPFPGQWDNS